MPLPNDPGNSRVSRGLVPIIRPLNGHSGALVILVEGAGYSFVRKMAGTPETNGRLRQQCAKLQAANRGGIPCPAVYSTGEQDGLFYFDMEYVPAGSIAQTVLSGQPMQWDAVMRQVLNAIARYRVNAIGEIPPAAFLAKLDSVVAQCNQTPCTASWRMQIHGIAAKLRELDWSGIPQSDSHGDMTLENMLLRPDNLLVFIDFDIAGHSSWMMDLAKIYQDVLGYWCLRSLAVAEPFCADLVNAQIRLGRFAAMLESPVAEIIPNHRQRLAMLASFHLFRTLPYIRENRLPAYVLQRISALLSMM